MFGDDSLRIDVTSEEATQIERGTVLGVQVNMAIKSGNQPGTTVGAKFTRDSGDEPFDWVVTGSETNTSGFRNIHCIVTQKAADYVEEHYGVEVDTKLIKSL